MAVLEVVQRQLPLVFPMHPRTRKMAETFGMRHYMQIGRRPIASRWAIYEVSLTRPRWLILTDSGGLQEEAVLFLESRVLHCERTPNGPSPWQWGDQVVGNKPAAI